MGRFRMVGGLVREFVLFLKEDRTWWLAPILVALVGLGRLHHLRAGLGAWRPSSTRCSKRSSAT